MLRGDDVAELQRRLNALGFDAGREDGILGAETEPRAASSSSATPGSPTDGMCGPATIAALDRVGSLADGSVASVRERETLRRDPRRLEDRGVLRRRRPRPRGARRPRSRAGSREPARSSRSTSPAPTTRRRRGRGQPLRRRPLPRAPHRRRRPGAAAPTSRSERFRSEAGFRVATAAHRGRSRRAARRRAAPSGGPTPSCARRAWPRWSASSSRATTRRRCARSSPRPRRSPRAIVAGVRRGVEEPLDVAP